MDKLYGIKTDRKINTATGATEPLEKVLAHNERISLDSPRPACDRISDFSSARAKTFQTKIMNLAENENRFLLRRQRIEEYTRLNGSQHSGLVVPSLVAWLLVVCRQRVSFLLDTGVLEVKRVAGIRQASFASVVRYAKVGDKRKLRKRELRTSK